MWSNYGDLCTCDSTVLLPNCSDSCSQQHLVWLNKLDKQCETQHMLQTVCLAELMMRVGSLYMLNNPHILESDNSVIIQMLVCHLNQKARDFGSSKSLWLPKMSKVVSLRGHHCLLKIKLRLMMTLPMLLVDAHWQLLPKNPQNTGKTSLHNSHAFKKIVPHMLPRANFVLVCGGPLVVSSFPNNIICWSNLVNLIPLDEVNTSVYFVREAWLVYEWFISLTVTVLDKFPGLLETFGFHRIRIGFKESSWCQVWVQFEISIIMPWNGNMATTSEEVKTIHTTIEYNLGLETFRTR